MGRVHHTTFLFLVSPVIEAYSGLEVEQGWHRLEKYLIIEGFLEKYLKIKYALKRTGKSLKDLEKSLNYYFM